VYALVTATPAALPTRERLDPAFTPCHDNGA
jgi:hypothetical protein